MAPQPQMSSTAPPHRVGERGFQPPALADSGAPPAQALTAAALNPKDLSVSSGLADFQASMSGDFADGTDAVHVNYQVSQHTATSGVAKSSGLAVTQTQTAALAAHFAHARDGAKLDVESGNYDAYRIADTASTTTSFAYDDDKLQNAAVVNRVDRSETVETLVNHKIVAEKTTPYNIFTMRDISAQLSPTY